MSATGIAWYVQGEDGQGGCTTARELPPRNTFRSAKAHARRLATQLRTPPPVIAVLEAEIAGGPVTRELGAWHVEIAGQVVWYPHQAKGRTR